MATIEESLRAVATRREAPMTWASLMLEAADKIDELYDTVGQLSECILDLRRCLGEG